MGPRAARAARGWLGPKEPVIVLRIAREVRAYPIQILMFHEIVNDTLAGVPVTVTFCPLCNASIVFDRRAGGRVLEFALRDARYVDTAIGSEWNLLGEAIAGPLKGKRLAQLESGVHFAFAWLAFNPDSEIVRALP